MWELLHLLWQAGKDQATMLVMQAANAEREGDAAKAAARQWRSWRRLQDAVEMLGAQADQDATTANTSGFGNRR